MKGRLKIFLRTLLLALCAAALVFVCGCESSYDWVVKTVKKNYLYELPDDCVYDGDVKKFVSSYLDIYSAYYTAEEYRAQYASNNGNKVGMGITYGFIAEGRHPSGKSGVFIEKVVGNSPVALSGLKRGVFVTGAADPDAGYVPFTTEKAFTDYVDGKKVEESFALVTDGGSYEVCKKPYTASYCSMRTATADFTITYENNEPVLAVSEGGIAELPEYAAYVRIDQFYGQAATELGILARRFREEGCTSVILDLRGNGGGYVSVMSNIAYVFVGAIPGYESVSMRAVYRNGANELYHVSGRAGHEVNGSSHTHELPTFPAGIKVSVLADNMTASASEALIGVLVDNGVVDYSDIYLSDFSEEYLNYSGSRAKNCRTYGKGIMQTTFLKRFTGEALKLTTAAIYWPKGTTCIHGTGLNLSMGCKALPAAWSVTYGDEQLSLAISRIYGN